MIIFFGKKDYNAKENIFMQANYKTVLYINIM